MKLHSADVCAPKPSRPGWYKRLFARVLASNSRRDAGPIADYKRQLLGNLHGRVLEIGPGTGPNLAYYPDGVHWIGVEPNLAMHPYLQKTARSLKINIELLSHTSERLPLPDESIDAVVGTHVLCSVQSVSGTLQEILRVLKPGGSYVFIEHVAAPSHTFLRRFQGWMRPVWQVWADGCQLNRETWTAIETAGFSQVHLEHFYLDVPIVAPHIAGYAIK
jgi:ubiquinone/menaquinone biosynthesis C-methylase UbiE